MELSETSIELSRWVKEVYYASRTTSIGVMALSESMMVCVTSWSKKEFSLD
jgi:hypothetical protein